MPLTIGYNSLIALQRMYHSRCVVAKTESIDAMREIQWGVIEQRVDVDVTVAEMNAFAAGYVKIAGHFVQRQSSVYATSVKWLVRLD